ncbi:MAG: hypothetical protein HYU87_05125 [Chloroflexi bacterium]|nr:hypothetical protein [Chloroflexota bacterium]
MPTEEGRQVLELLAQGKIDAEQAYRLLRALGDIRDAPPAPPPPPADRGHDLPPATRGRVLRIRVSEHGKQKVNVAIPLAIARIGKMKLGASGLVRGHLQKFGLDLDELLREVESAGRIVDINDDEDRVEIFVE